jgi:hypothetical protein
VLHSFPTRCSSDLWTAFCDFAKVFRPDVFLRNGDIFDFYGISRFNHDQKRADNMAGERDAFIEHEEMIQKALPKRCICIANKGNHEDRVYKYITRRPDTVEFMKRFGMEWPTWYSFLQLDKGGYDCRYSEGVRLPRVMFGDLAVWHGQQSNKYSVAANVAKMGNNACNHTHRCRSWSSVVGGGNRYGYEMGHMADVKVAHDYIEDQEDWQQGFGVLHYDDANGYFDLEVVTVKTTDKMRKHRFSYGGDIWEW